MLDATDEYDGVGDADALGVDDGATGLDEPQASRPTVKVATVAVASAFRIHRGRRVGYMGRVWHVT